MRAGLRLLLVLFVSTATFSAVRSDPPNGPEFRVNSFTTDRQADPAVAATPDGGFVVVWTSNYQDGQYDGIVGQRYGSDGAPLGPEFRVNSYTSYVQRNPSIAVDASGSFVVVWDSPGGAEGLSYGVVGQRYTGTGAPLGAAFRVNTYTPSNQRLPDVACDPAGGFVVVWQSYGQEGPQYGLQDGIFGQRFTSIGGKLGAEFRVNTTTTKAQSAPVVAMAPSGDFVVVWQSYRGDASSYGVFGQRFGSDGAERGGEFRVNTYTSGDQTAPRVAAGSSGDFLVVFTSYHDGSFSGIFGQRYASSGAPEGDEFQVNAFTTLSQLTPAVTGVNGGFVVVWYTYRQDASLDGVFGRHFAPDGAPVGLDFAVNTFTTSPQQRPAVASRGDGTFVVIWESGFADNSLPSQDGSNQGIYGQRFCGGPSVTAPAPAIVVQTLCS